MTTKTTTTIRDHGCAAATHGAHTLTQVQLTKVLAPYPDGIR